MNAGWATATASVINYQGRLAVIASHLDIIERCKRDVKPRRNSGLPMNNGPLAPEQRDKPGASSSQQGDPENNEMM
jgi:hypothetical protein